LTWACVVACAAEAKAFAIACGLAAAGAGVVGFTACMVTGNTPCTDFMTDLTDPIWDWLKDLVGWPEEGEKPGKSLALAGTVL
jgi:hypothetical protein